MNQPSANTARVKDEVASAGQAAASSTWLEALARTGLVARGVVYALIGVLALQIAFGSSDHNADRTGAMRVVVEQPGGTVVLWALALGFAGLALWRFAEAAFGKAGPDGKKATKRLTSLGGAVLYTSFLVATVAFLLGNASHQSGNQQSETMTAKLMSHPGGRWLVFAVGIALIIVGATLVVRGFQKKFLEHLDLSGLGTRGRETVEMLGLVGSCSRGLVFGVVGGLLAWAALSFNPDKATGLDGALHKLAQTPLGPWLLAAVALGLVGFGVYSCCEARWREVTSRNAAGG